MIYEKRNVYVNVTCFYFFIRAVYGSDMSGIKIAAHNCIIGMLITGIVLGPYVLDLLDPSILSISFELRQMALIIILLKAGFSLDLSDLKKLGGLQL